MQAPTSESAALRRHLDDAVRGWIGLSADADAPRLPAELERLLLRTEERERPHRDRLGCWEFAYSENYRRGRLWEPEVDVWAAEERRRLAGTHVLEPLWPEGQPFAVALTHDVDMVSRSSTPGQVLRGARRKLTTLGTAAGRERVLRLVLADGQPGYWGLARVPDTAGTLGRCLELERELGVASTYFFAVYPGRRSSPYDCIYDLRDPCSFRGRCTSIGAMAGEIAAAGHEIGLHGSYRSALDGQTLARERAELERGTGLTVTTTRQHLLRWEVGRTPRAQAEAGLLADSSVGFNRNVGFRTGSALPFRPFDVEADRPVDVLELPLVLQEGPLLAPAGLDLDRALAEDVLTRILDAVAATGGVATLLFHPHSFVVDDFADLYRTAIQQALARGAWVAPLGEIAAWWRERESRLGLAA